MRIAIDARELRGQPTGVGRVLAGVLDAWRSLPEAASHEFLLCTPAARDGADGNASIRSITRRGWTNPTFWEQFSLPQLVRESGADVLFAPGYTGPLLTSVPVVPAIYDVSFAAHPEWFGAKEGLRRRLLTRATARRAARIITSSRFSRDEIVRHLGVAPDKIDVIYPGFQAAPAPPAAGVTNRVLFVGSLFTRRHLPDLIRGFAQLVRDLPDARLDIVGDNRTAPRVDFQAVADEAGVADRVALRAYVTDVELASLYGAARAFVFLSEYEGFGLTPLEALAAGVPIAVLDTPIAREIYGDAALYVAAPDPALIRPALHRLLTDDTERARILHAAQATLARYSWRTCAAAVLRTLVQAAR